MQADTPGSPDTAFIFPVQRQNRPSANWRGYDGTVMSGAAKTGQVVHVLPGGQASTIKVIRKRPATPS